MLHNFLLRKMFLYRLEVFTLLFTILSNNLNHTSYTSHFTDQFVNEVSVNNLCVVRAKNMADAKTSRQKTLSCQRLGNVYLSQGNNATRAVRQVWMAVYRCETFKTKTKRVDVGSLILSRLNEETKFTMCSHRLKRCKNRDTELF